MVGPSIDCLNNPLGAVRLLFDKACAGQIEGCPGTSNGNDWGAKSLFDEYLYQCGGYKQVPEINSVPLGAIPGNSLVRFRGMVQESFEPEYYIGAYKVPGENDWVKQAFLSGSLPLTTNDNSGSAAPLPNHPGKRTREIDDMNDVEMDTITNAESVDSKRLKGGINPVDSPPQNSDFSMPLGKSRLSPCIVKFYDGAEADIKINDVIEVTGVLTFEPNLAARSLDTYTSFMNEGVWSGIPEIWLPRLHSITYRKLFSHKIHEAFPRTDEVDTIVMETPFTLRQLRESIVEGLTRVLGGDDLSAEYLLLHLLSQVYHRSDTVILGKISLNIFAGDTMSSESSVQLASRVAEAVQSLLPWSHLMRLSPDYLNKGPLYPRKDHDRNRLVTGALQLADGTYLILDETAMGTGRWSGMAMENLDCLRYLMYNQKVEYDFEYFKMHFPTDIPLLIISKERSKNFPADIALPLGATADISSLCMDNSVIARCRQFLTSVRNATHTLDSSMQKIVEEDFVEARQKNPRLPPEALDRWLTMGRLLCLSYGQTSLSLEQWKRVLEMEELRDKRLGTVIHPYELPAGIANAGSQGVIISRCKG